jgi:hypothetical protein
MELSSAAVSCLRAFQQFVTEANLYPAFEAEVSCVLWQDELGRLRVWAGNIGVHQMGESSLEYRLRDASHIRAQVTRLVSELRQVIRELHNLVSGGSDQSDQGSGKVEHADDSMSMESELISQLSNTSEKELTEMQQLHEDVVDIINNLYKTSMLIRHPAARDRFLKRRKEDAMGFEPFDVDHVVNKFPRLDNAVAQRLGSAITWRRRNLKYWERHHAKLSHGVEEDDDLENEDLLSQTVATSLENTHLHVDETSSTTGFSQTSYASSILSGGAITVPTRPKASLMGRAFQCDICFYIITIQDDRSWARHVFKDLLPYICIFSKCSSPNKLYDSRHEWFRHIRTSHMQCMSAEQPLNMSCPLCGSEPLYSAEFERHVAKHLEELALFVLPNEVTDDDDDLGVEKVYCHRCNNEWRRDQGGLTCLQCGSEFTEILPGPPPQPSIPG